MFKFDFNVQLDDGNEPNPFSTNIDQEKKEQPEPETNNLQIYKSEQLCHTANYLENLGLFKLNATFLNAGKYRIYYVKSGNLLEAKKVEDIKKAELHNSDLLPGVYEGGAKIWECTHDLINYFVENYSFEFFENKSVLDLGCGSGLLGLYALKSNAKVEFQDYNKDVLELITIPNALINIDNEKLNELSKWIRFYSGDWKYYLELTKDEEKFDLILTSETIYNAKNQQKLLDTFYWKLKDNGLILLAGKVYYFGVGGGLRQFEELIKTDGRFVSTVIWKSNDGVCREILAIKHTIKSF